MSMALLDALVRFATVGLLLNLFFLNPETNWGAVVFTNADQATDFLTVVSARLAGLDGYQP